MTLPAWFSLALSLLTLASMGGGTAVFFRSEAGKSLLALKTDTIATLQAQAASLKDQYEAALSEITSLKARLEQVEQNHVTQLAAKDAEIARLRQELEREQATCKRLQDRLKKAEGRIGQLERRLAAGGSVVTADATPTES